MKEGIILNNDEATETQLRDAVLHQLAWNANIISTEIGVIASDGIITLTGWVDSLSEKLAAERTARNVFGVKGVANDILIRQFSALTDTDIARNAVHALESDTRVPPDKVTVLVSNGWVRLEGRVSSEAGKEAAIDTVQSLLGVKGVVSEIEVMPEITEADICNSGRRNAQPVTDARHRTFREQAELTSGATHSD